MPDSGVVDEYDTKVGSIHIYGGILVKRGLKV